MTTDFLTTGPDTPIALARPGDANHPTPDLSEAYALMFGEPNTDGHLAVAGDLRQLRAFLRRATALLDDADPDAVFHDLTVYGMTADELTELAALLNLHPLQVGNQKSEAAGRYLSPRNLSSAAAYRQARDYVHRTGLTYTETQFTTYNDTETRVTTYNDR